MKTLLALAILITAGFARADENQSATMLNLATVTGNGARISPRAGKIAFQATGSTTAGAGAVSISIRASNDGVSYIEIGTISLVLSPVIATDGFTSDSAWKYFIANITAISGTNASASLIASSKL